MQQLPSQQLTTACVSGGFVCPQTESIKPQFEAFSKGFMMVCGGPALNLFHAQELEALVGRPPQNPF